jgi:DNA primase
MKDNDWLETAKSLRCGQTIRTKCSDNCGNRNSQLVTHDDRGYTRHCFRCDSHEHVKHELRSIQTLEQAKRDKEIMRAWDYGNKLIIPNDANTNFPKEALLWLFKYGITESLIHKNEIQWSEFYGRVVLPVKENGVLTALQMRAVRPGVYPKYLNPKGPKIDAALKWCTEKYHKKNTLVIVEDILSAIKVGTVADAVSILGTNLTDARLDKIRTSGYKTIIIWLDSDAPGQAGAKLAKLKLQMVGLYPQIYTNEKDPKELSRDYIERVIAGY